ncbi:hypothetical protein [Acidisoma sp. S159]|uniref:hypothetical protein n=1 Tax=Acidisoma sp. S159 TaxID=1747225 RepID=UPI00131D69C2|nr:hypothetical protein [Acidisoma sp. S159]
MAYRNPDYDPNWQERHDAHALARDRAQQEAIGLIEAGQMPSDAYAHAHARWQDHDAVCKAALTTSQHETVQDYAAWLFRSAPPDRSDHDVGVFVPVVDFEELRTMEEATAAWSRIHNLVEEAVNDQRCSLPIGQPEGMVAFEDATSPNLTRNWREFTPRELYPGGAAGTAGVWTLMTVDAQVDSWHVCFTHRWGSPGISVTNAIERLATAVYREASAIAAQPSSGRVGPGFRIGRLLGRKPALLDPGRFHFYDHTPPAPSGGWREDFSWVALRFENGEFKNPEWQHYQVIPHVIQSARFELARNATYSCDMTQAVIADQRAGLLG